ILEGWDHLAFLLCLTALVWRRRSSERNPSARAASSAWARLWPSRTLLATVTAFTLAHSLTLAATVLGWVQVPPAPVEACIAASVLVLAAAWARSLVAEGRGAALDERELVRHAGPWAAGVFGLLHGFGFAGA